MLWALRQKDPHGLLNMPDIGETLIAQNDGPFKSALDHTKYAVHYPDLDPQSERKKASDFIQSLNTRLTEDLFLTGESPTLADIAIFPFVRQFAHIDRTWFNAQAWPRVILWLDGFLQSTNFQMALTKVPIWGDGARPYLFNHASEWDCPWQEKPSTRRTWRPWAQKF